MRNRIHWIEWLGLVLVVLLFAFALHVAIASKDSAERAAMDKVELAR